MNSFKIAIIMLMLFSTPLLSQMSGISNYDTDKIFQNDLMEKMSADELMKSDQIPVGNIVDPDFYYLGPGDMLAVQNLAYSIKYELVSVTQENTILMPRIGEIDVNGRTLTEIRQEIEGLMLDRNENAQVFVSLFKPRNVLVTIAGNVSLEGTYTLPASYSVSTAIKISNQPYDQKRIPQNQLPAILKYQEKLQEKEKLFSNSGIAPNSKYFTRNIIIIHNDGTARQADIEKSKALNDPEYDPYIREGDRIIVPFEPAEFTTVSISGAVNKPSVFAYKKDDKLSLLLKFGYGLADNADLDNVFLYMPSSKDRRKVQIDENMNLLSEDINLEPGAMLIVQSKSIESHKKFGIVSVTGNVKSPGTYPINIDETQLTELIKQAGGFTEEAYLPLAYIVRRDNEMPSSINHRYNLNEKFQYSSLTMEDTTRFQLHTDNRRQVVSCDFPNAFKDHSSEDNVLLEDGDLIIVPSMPKRIFVYGQVKQPGYITYVPGKSMEWYINRAGGYTEQADDDRARIIRGKTQVWIEGEPDVAVLAGDEIYVPSEPDIPPGYELQRYAAYAGITAAVATLVNVLVWMVR